MQRRQRLAAEEPHHLGCGDNAGEGGDYGHGQGEVERVLLLAQVEIADAAADCRVAGDALQGGRLGPVQ